MIRDGGCFNLESLRDESLTPLTAPGGLGQLTLALGRWLGRRPLATGGCRLLRCAPDGLGHLQGDAHEVDEAPAILDAAGIRFNTLKELQAFVEARHIDFLQTFERLRRCHMAHHSTGIEVNPSDLDLGVGCNGFKNGSQACLSEAQC